MHGQIAGAVHDDGELDAEVVDEVHALPPTDVGIRQYAVERHAARLRVVVERVEGGDVSRGDRAGGVEKHQRRRSHLSRRYPDPVLASLDVGHPDSNHIDEIAGLRRRIGRRERARQQAAETEQDAK